MALRASPGWALSGPLIWVVIVFLVSSGKADGAVERVLKTEVVTQIASPIRISECLHGRVSGPYAGSEEQDGRVDLTSWLKAVSIFPAPNDRA